MCLIPKLADRYIYKCERKGILLVDCLCRLRLFRLEESLK